MTILERWGLYHINRYLSSRTLFLHRLSLTQVTRLAVLLSFIIGFFITLIIAIAEIIVFSEISALIGSLYLLFVFIVLNLGLIAIEFWLLFHIGFQVVARYINFIEQQHPIDSNMRASLVRAILEINEPAMECFGLDPYKQKSKHYWLRLITYKMKVILSNFVAKIIARKLLTRLGLRSYAPLIATIITGWWDAWIQKTVLTEVRFRLASRLYAIQLLLSVKLTQPATLETLIRLISVRTELFGQYNINLHYLLTEIDRNMTGSINDFERLFDTQELERCYQDLKHSEQQRINSIAIKLFAFKRNRLSYNERQLLTFFRIKPEIIEHTKKQFDDLFGTQSFNWLMENSHG
jgi:hypothetical protein